MCILSIKWKSVGSNVACIPKFIKISSFVFYKRMKKKNASRFGMTCKSIYVLHLDYTIKGLGFHIMYNDRN